jgi:CPA1 family monovalent cation:H+ antiporter
MLRRVGIPKGIQAQLAGESLFNDGIGAVLFITMLEVAKGHAPTPWHISGFLFIKAGGAVAVGIAAALVTSRLMRTIDVYQVNILFTLALAFGGYVLADFLHLSAPLEAVVAGISLRYFIRGVPRDRIDHEHITSFWAVIDEIQNSVLFVLLGLEAMAVALDASTLRTGLVAITSVNLVRFAVVGALLAIARLWKRGFQSSTLILTWGGLRGGLSIALALSVPPEFGRSWMLTATYLVVVFSVIIQGGTLDLVMRRSHAKAA